MSKLTRIVFLVGVPKNFANVTEFEAFQRQLIAEINRYGDLLLVDVVDTYMNITQKLLTLYDFILAAPECSPECAPLMRYILKPDDDTFVNPSSFVKRLGELDALLNKYTRSFFYGYVIYPSGMVSFKSLNKNRPL